MNNRALKNCGISGMLGAIVLLLMSSGASAGEIERNWAIGGSASQSSTAIGGDAARAIDGNTNGDWNAGSVTHTNVEVDPYWQIDLGASHYVDEIRIFNRTDCCGDRLKNFAVFFANNKEGFLHRDFSSTTGQNNGNPDTGVYFKPFFFQSGDVDPITGVKLARQTIKIDGGSCNHGASPGCLMRYVRIQLAGEGTLSLAEVQIVEKANLPGPALVDDALTWAPTDIVPSGNGIALTATDQSLLLFYRGNDKLLHASVDLAGGPAVAGSPPLGPNAPSAASFNSRVYVAAQTANNDAAVVVSDVSGGSFTASTWSVLGKATAPPTLVVACGKVAAAWLDHGQVKSSWKPSDVASTANWSAPQVAAMSARAPPSLAADATGNIGMSFLLADGSIAFVHSDCSAPGLRWSGVEKLVGQSHGDRASLASYGPHFIIATLGDDNRGYVAMQKTVHTAADPGHEVWQGFEPIPASERGDTGLVIAEAPRIFVMSGAIVATARERSTHVIHYWIKYPNHIAPGDPWMGGRFVGVSMPASTGTQMVSFGHSRLWGNTDAPAELYAASVGIADHHVHALNLGRFIANDVLVMDLHLTLEGMFDIDPQPNRSLDVTIAPNLFEQMVALLSMPKLGRDAVLGNKCGNSPLTLSTFLVLDRGPGTGQFRPDCPLKVIEFTEQLSAGDLFHEWLHSDAAARALTGISGFGDVFQFNGTGMNTSENGLKACSSNTDCGGDACEMAGDAHGNPGGWGSTRVFADGETELRRWDNTFVCIAPGGPEGRRYQGGVRWYDIGTADHAFIHTAIAYRWYGDDLRDWVRADLAHGNDQLQRRYNWVKTFYFGSVEYNGRMDSGSSLPHSDRSLGFYGMPLQ